MIDKSHRGISQAIGHHYGFMKTKPSFKYDFGDVFWFDSKMMVSRFQVNLEKGFCFCN